MEKVEILAPAGSMESLVAAINKGADAVYLGGNKFSARAYASNFDNDNMLKAVEYAHSYDVKIYVTLNTILKENEVELVILAGYLKIVSPKLVDEYRNKIINIHPSLIPSFCGKGYYGEKVHQGVIDYGAKVTGATVHFVDEGADTGPIIIQKTVEVKQDDDAKKLAERVLEVEHEILTKSISMFCENKLTVNGRRVYIND